ncbi:cytochrome c biogenesis heme-transporting ATPase CcmA [Alteromonas lipolytica]|uniref:Heme ABC exporter ATP-binding protein CcmA n=1 Tax=Alteromonas lipolytica TaxID=1856405 RepID=A0A1E8FAS6_9ALTE|nr:cytochrome c biogenesis heme-transporting ATPase CcmA [Alteromonas lipolytica]OFI32603.1 heme ABC exporter ATP-binding protein CcmA [Alteromonas lipolytica]GGF74740.1 cytochrome c biogenesis ATP-binding export protein CcmA [Alteromonas lipolytica]
MAGLAADNLTCIKRDRVLFTDLSFALLPGRLIYLRGPNGAGKTSLLRILTGLSAPDAGELSLDGQPLERQRDTFNQQLIYVGHKAGLNGALTAMENLRFWCAQHGAEFVPADTYRVLALLGLVGLEEVPVRMLSAGQQRRVALSRLWLKKATYWILDEPFTALDTDGIALLEKHMRQHVAQNGAIITTSHQPLSDLAGPMEELVLEYRL